MTIYKYILPESEGLFAVEMPGVARVIRTLCVQKQDGAPVLWVLVEPGAKFQRVVKEYAWRPTGQSEEIGVLSEYVGTVQMGWLVWHLFEVVR